MLHYESADSGMSRGRESLTLHLKVVIKESLCKLCSLRTDSLKVIFPAAITLLHSNGRVKLTEIGL